MSEDNKEYFKKILTPEQEQEIITLRKDLGLSVRKIANFVDFKVSRETVRLLIHKHLGKNYAKQIQSKTRLQKVVPKYQTTRDYDFLQYIRPVFRWAIDNYELRRDHIELLLYLYPKGIFEKNDFYEYHKIIGMYQVKTFHMMLKKGFIKKWRDHDHSQKALYELTNKAKTMCSKMHKYLTGELKMTTNPRYNNTANQESRMSGYYMDVINKMNKNAKSDTN